MMQETESHDLALEQAGIQDFNIMPYTSVMPPESHEILREEAVKHHSYGAVLETIMAQINGVKAIYLLAVHLQRAMYLQLPPGDESRGLILQGAPCNHACKMMIILHVLRIL